MLEVVQLHVLRAATDVDDDGQRDQVMDLFMIIDDAALTPSRDISTRVIGLCIRNEQLLAWAPPHHMDSSFCIRSRHWVANWICNGRRVNRFQCCVQNVLLIEIYINGIQWHIDCGFGMYGTSGVSERCASKCRLTFVCYRASLPPFERGALWSACFHSWNQAIYAESSTCWGWVVSNQKNGLTFKFFFIVNSHALRR